MNNRSILKNLSRILLGIGFFCLTTLELYAQSTSDLLKTNFSSPPNNIHVGTFWYWVSDNISKEGVIEDLHAMKKPELIWLLLVLLDQVHIIMLIILSEK